MLMEEGSFILPENVPANEFLNLEGDKISTSRNWAVWLHEYLEEFKGKQDELRYVLTSIAPETADSEFTWKDYQARVNNELVAILGNFINRINVLMFKYFEGKVPGNGKVDIIDQQVHDAIGKTYDSLVSNIENYKFRQGLFEVMDLARFGNKYLTDAEPWKTMATNPEKATQVLSDCLLIVAHLGACLQPFLPNTAKKIFRSLNLKEEFKWNEEIVFEAGHQLNKGELLFAKVEDEQVQKQIDKLNESKKLNAVPTFEPLKETIVFDDFAKLDLRLGQILEAELVPKTKKLLKLKIDLGFEQRTIVSGIAEFYKPEEIINKKVSCSG
jgi:methionyl-tRNA synthetase